MLPRGRCLSSGLLRIQIRKIKWRPARRLSARATRGESERAGHKGGRSSTAAAEERGTGHSAAPKEKTHGCCVEGRSSTGAVRLPNQNVRGGFECRTCVGAITDNMFSTSRCETL